MDKSENVRNHELSADLERKSPSADKLMIPKHRFDCVNLCLKETKQALKDKSLALDNCCSRIRQLEQALVESKVEIALALERAKDLTAVKALIDFSKLELKDDGTVSGLSEQIRHIKQSRAFLFEESDGINYILVPLKSEDALNKSIANYVKKIRRLDK